MLFSPFTLFYLDYLVVVNVVQSISSISSSHHGGVGQEVGAMDPILKIKLVKDFMLCLCSNCEPYVSDVPTKAEHGKQLFSLTSAETTDINSLSS